MLVAGRYLPQRSLIGPALFPAYRYVLRLVILWILVSIFILVVGPATILSSRNPSLALIETAWTLTMAAVFAFGVITLVFAILERARACARSEQHGCRDTYCRAPRRRKSRPFQRPTDNWAWTRLT